MKLHVLILVLFTLLLSGCIEEEKGIGKFGMMDENTPEYAALVFMKSIYAEKNIKGAVRRSTDSMARVLKSYHTNRNVQHHVINLRYDNVEITPHGGNRVGRNEFSDEATVTLFFSGNYKGDKIEDLRTVGLVRMNGDWKVDDVHPDHFM